MLQYHIMYTSCSIIMDFFILHVLVPKNTSPSLLPTSITILLLRAPLSICLGGIISVLYDQILRSVVMSSREVRIQDILRPLRVPLLRIDTGPRHMRHGGIPSTVGVLCVAKRVVFRCWLWKPDVASVPSQMTRFQGFGDVFFHDDGSARGVDQPGTCRMKHVSCFAIKRSGGVSYQASSWKSIPC